MSAWTTEQVLALAPDSASVAPGRALASPAKWISCGTHDHALWGEAKGSGANPYQTAIDLREPAFKCSCPSRKFPCKHSLGLFLRFAQGEIPLQDPPEWVLDWLQKRDTKAAMTSEPKAEPNPEEAEKRVNKRWGNILNGLDECEAFLTDAVSQGLITMASARSWDEMAARMVDAQAPGVALRLKQIGARVGVGESWGSLVTGQLGSLFLLLEATRRADSLQEDLSADVRTALGIPSRKEDLPDESMFDTWDVLGQAIDTEDRVTTCRSWLRARASGRWAMHLSFSVAGQPFDFRPVPGSALAASVKFYPSSCPQRVHPLDHEVVPFEPPKGETWASALDAFAESLAHNPWIEQTPVHLHGARLGREGNRWFAIDHEGAAMPLAPGVPWALLAMSGNQPCELFGEWTGNTMRILGAWGEWGYLPL